MQYKIEQKLIPLKENDVLAPGMCMVEILTREEYEEKYKHLVKGHLLMHTMEHIGQNKVDIFREYLIGTFCIPQKKNLTGPEQCCAFFMDREKLIFVEFEEEKFVEKILKGCEKYRIVDMTEPSHVLFGFMSYLISKDVEFIQNYEDHLEKKETEMAEDVNEIPKDFEQYVLKTRKELMHLDRYYKQMSEMGQLLEDCPNELIGQEAKENFRFFSNKADRLHADAEYLREYSIQIRDMYQSRIDVRQNKVMQLLTIVTTVFMPLTLMTGWYGMNFDRMPELHMEWSYFIMIVVVILIIIAELIFFKKKKWI